MDASLERMVVDVTVAALHVVLKTRVGETKIPQNDILPLCICLGRVIGAVGVIPVEKGPYKREF